MNWTRGCSIGRGSSATVSLATTHHSGEVLAVKSAQLAKSDFLQREQKILSSITSQYIVDYKGCDITMENGSFMYNIFMEYIAGGTLTDAITRNGGSLSESTIRSYTLGILKGLDYLHSNGIVHCDIKGSNILIGKDGVKIADLGCGRRAADASPIAGTPLFMAPEVARGEEQGYPADIWALGCTMIEMATGCPPWQEVADPISAIYRIALTNDVPEFPSILSKQAKDFLSKCFRRDPKQRCSAHELLKHPFLDETDSSFKLLQLSALTSPTSILDQDLWNSEEELETPRGCSYYPPPAARLQQLVKGRLPTVTWDDNWVTIRSNEELRQTFQLENIYLNTVEQPAMSSRSYITVSSSPQAETENLISYRDLFKNYTVKDINSCTKSSSCSRRDFCKSLVSNIKFGKQISSSFISRSCEVIHLKFLSKPIVQYDKRPSLVKEN